ncbi:HAMP domain-containing sensor histidine kinase [uncultured Tateyamaria sp.]|uniref:ATP-binding protein n=1 Tax=uncultured Tateyamaria sp. TaxID=455651 RepID=UPI00261D2CFE|nr:HAMP domain-containing sensor histidine kinase [uncultured Tateyamaria sp.]
MLSLRHRALLGSLASGLISVAVGALTLYAYVDSRVQERFDATLRDRHTQVVVALSTATSDPERLRDLIFDPAYGTPFSGRYWQVTSSDGQIVTSASLFDQTFDEPTQTDTGLIVWDIVGPENEGVRGVYQRITYEDGSEWGVSVAESLTELIHERSDTRQSLLLVFSLVGMIGLAGSVMLISTILWPLRRLRKDVAKRWDHDEELVQADYPEEVAPLVSDINALLQRNRDIVMGARRQAADLAHALKTPSAILRNELDVLSDKDVGAPMAFEALDRIDAQIGRSLARMRAANSAELTHSRTDLSNSVDRFSRLFSMMAEREGKSLRCKNARGLWVRMDTQDIEEVIGNLLDNALKWSRHTVQLTAEKADGCVMIYVEDDGPGIPEESQREALRSGGRLDTSKPGTGLGLAIAVDLLKAYGADLALENSGDLGGLAVKVLIPTPFDLQAA